MQLVNQNQITIAEAAVSRSNLISISWVGSANDIPSELFNRCFAAPLEGLWWYEALEHGNLNDQFEFAYAVIHKGSKPIGIAPSFIMNVPLNLVAPEELVAAIKAIPFLTKLFPSLLYQRTLFIGSPCADEGTVGLLDNTPLSEVLPALSDALKNRAAELKASVIAWKDFAEHDCKSLDELINTSGFFKIPSYPGTVVSLPNGRFENYLHLLNSEKRYKLKKKLKRSSQKGVLESSVIQHPNEETLATIFDLFWKTYEHGKTKFERLTPDFFRRIAQEKTSYFVLLKESKSNRYVAFMLCFKLGDHVINKFIGLDYSYSGDWFLYYKLWEAAVNWAMDLEATEIQSGQTGYSGKLDLGHRLVPLTNYCKHTNLLMNLIYKIASHTVSWSTLDSDLAVYLKAHPEVAHAQYGNKL